MNDATGIHLKTSVLIFGACPHDCPDTCSLLTTVEDGVATRVQGTMAQVQVQLDPRPVPV
ncbi:MAG: hypothetical protein ACREWJ_03310 [Rhodoferax sp.]